MNKAEEAASRAFLEQVLRSVQDETSRQEVEYLIQELFPVLIPGIIHLLKAHSEQERRKREDDDEDDDSVPIQPLDHLARYLFRRNPRHGEPVEEVVDMQALARKILRK